MVQYMRVHSWFLIGKMELQKGDFAIAKTQPEQIRFCSKYGSLAIQLKILNTCVIMPDKSKTSN